MARIRLHLSCAVLAGTLACGGSVSFASAVNTENSSRVVGGDLVKPCSWPAAGIIISLEQGCTASLVHPEIIITAAHCTALADYVWFGDSTLNQTSKRYAIRSCTNHPDYDEKSNLLGKHTDLAYCTLERPVVGVPITPILMGCELEALQPGTPVYQVGFGNTSDTSSGTSGNKRQVLTTFNGFSKRHNGEALVGEPGKGACHGDSGGPVYIKLPESKFGADAGWRVFGVTSGGDGGCPGEARFGVMSTFVEFVEQHSGMDITPCTDADGTWNPGPMCKEAPLNPFAVSGDWVGGCSAAPVGGFIQTCGKPFDPDSDSGGGTEETDKLDDSEAPKALVVTPYPNQRVPVGAPVEVRVSATDNDQVAEVELFLDGNSVGKRNAGPFRWRLEELLVGAHSVRSKVTDRSGNAVDSDPVEFLVYEADVGAGNEDTNAPGGASAGGGEAEPGDAPKGKDPEQQGDIQAEGSFSCRSSTGGIPFQAMGTMFVFLLTLRRRD